MNNFFQEDFSSLQRALNNNSDELQSAFRRGLEVICTALKAGNKLITFGNGGSASDAEHFVGEVIGRFGFDRTPLPAVSLCGASSSFTAIANDYGYDKVFERQVIGLGKPGDVAFGISTSGNSTNVQLGLKAAKKIGMSTIALTGQHPSPIEKIAEITLKAPSFETPRIQEIHIAVIHSLCRGIETVLFPEQSKKILPASKLVEASCVDAFFSLVKPYKSVFTNGCFDIIHPGHISLLNSCRSMGDLLIVGLNADESVKKLKGRKRPFYKLFDRATILSALSAVDYIIPFDADTPIDLIRRLSPSILVKGGDYQKETVVGADWVESHGGEVRIVPILKGYSTTFILEGKINE